MNTTKPGWVKTEDDLAKAKESMLPTEDEIKDLLKREMKNQGFTTFIDFDGVEKPL